MTERELLVIYKLSRQELDATKAQLKEVQARYDAAETAMVEFLISKEANESASYDGVGYCKLMKPRVFASCKIENLSALKAHLEQAGRKDLIKETITPAALSSYVAEVIDAGKAPPDMVSYYLKQSVKMY